MTRFKEIISTIIIFIQKNPLPTIIAMVIFLLFIPLIIFSNLSPSQNTPVPTSPPSVQIDLSPTTPAPTSSIYEEKTAKDSGPITFVESADGILKSKKETLSDGSIKYTMNSTNPKRSDIVIVKNGSVVFTRYTVTGGPEVSDGYKNLHGKQSHTFPGPTFYGPNTVIYFYENEGTALTVDSKTGTTYEEFSFQPPITVEEFNKTYKQYSN